MSQYCRPESVLTPSPEAWVGVSVFGVADFPVASCALTNTAVIARTTASAARYFAILPSYRNILTIRSREMHIGFPDSRESSLQPRTPASAGLLCALRGRS